MQVPYRTSTFFCAVHRPAPADFAAVIRWPGNQVREPVLQNNSDQQAISPASSVLLPSLVFPVKSPKFLSIQQLINQLFWNSCKMSEIPNKTQHPKWSFINFIWLLLSKCWLLVGDARLLFKMHIYIYILTIILAYI